MDQRNDENGRQLELPPPIERQETLAIVSPLVVGGESFAELKIIAEQVYRAHADRTKAILEESNREHEPAFIELEGTLNMLIEQDVGAQHIDVIREKFEKIKETKIKTEAEFLQTIKAVNEHVLDMQTPINRLIVNIERIKAEIQNINLD